MHTNSRLLLFSFQLFSTLISSTSKQKARVHCSLRQEQFQRSSYWATSIEYVFSIPRYAWLDRLFHGNIRFSSCAFHFPFDMSLWLTYDQWFSSLPYLHEWKLLHHSNFWPHAKNELIFNIGLRLRCHSCTFRGLITLTLFFLDTLWLWHSSWCSLGQFLKTFPIKGGGCIFKRNFYSRASLCSSEYDAFFT